MFKNNFDPPIVLHGVPDQTCSTYFALFVLILFSAVLVLHHVLWLYKEMAACNLGKHVASRSQNKVTTSSIYAVACFWL